VPQPQPKPPSFTFMAWQQESRVYLKHGHGLNFPCFITHRSALDCTVLRLMRPLFVKGVRPHALSDILLEMHAEEHARQHLLYEFNLERDRGFNHDLQRPLYSEFADPLQYAGRVPSGGYLAEVYIQFMDSIKQHLDTEVKKRGAVRLHWDVSYKEAKHLCRYKGHPVFKGLVTATNEHGEIRVQFHVVTDSHDQMEAAIISMVRTMQAYGQELTTHVFSDNVPSDKPFMLDTLPSVRAVQERYDNQRVQAAPGPTGGGLRAYTTDAAVITFCKSVTGINNIADNIRAVLGPEAELHFLGMDAEWVTTKTRRGLILSCPKRLDCIQLSYRTLDEARTQVAIFQVTALKALPDRLRELLLDKAFTFVGACIGGDLARMGRRFNLSKQMESVQRVELASMAKRVGVITDARSVSTLERLVELALKAALPKDESVRMSDWSRELSTEQMQYAAADAAASLDSYIAFSSLPDLTARINAVAACTGVGVRVVPKTGSLCVLACAGAVGKVESAPNAQYPAPLWCSNSDSMIRMDASKRRVRVSKVLSPSLIVPGVKKGRRAATLADFGNPPFAVILPLTMLAVNHGGSGGASGSGCGASTQAAAGSSGGTGGGGSSARGSSSASGCGGGASGSGCGASGSGGVAAGAHAAAGSSTSGSSSATGSSSGGGAGSGSGVIPGATTRAFSARMLSMVASMAEGEQDDGQGDQDGDRGDEEDGGGASGGDHDRAALTAGEITQNRGLQAAGAPGAAVLQEGTAAGLLGETLTPPDGIYSSVLGDCFHLMDRPKVLLLY
jgi:hypothetical protein